ncbi:MAG: hypothetical protein WC313_01110 [Candidatus Kapaibacterium sp.]|jgi:uncharacterized protein YoxC|nr:hypothetical protein [Candidatus Kapabacteria bacterium]
MILTLQILGIVALISFIFLALVIASTMTGIKKTIDNADRKLDKLSRDFDEVKVKTIQTLESVNELKDDLSGTLKGINEINGKVLDSLGHFNDMSKQITTSVNALQHTGSKLINLVEPIEIALETTIQKFMPGINAASKLFNAVGRGIATFSGRIKTG